MTSDYPCNVCRYQLTDMLQEPCAHCQDYQDYINRSKPTITKEKPKIDSPYTGSDDPDHGDEIERLLRLLQFQFDRMNDHLAQIAGQIYHIHEGGLTVRAYSGDVINQEDDR